MSRHYKDPSEWRDLRDLFKTKICTLFSRGHCPRDRCNFAHGEEELRKVPPAGSDRYEGGRQGGRRRSPSFRRRSPDYSPRKGRRSYSPPPRRRTKSPSELLEDGPNKRRKRDEDDMRPDELSEDIEADVLGSKKKEDEINGVDSEETEKIRAKEKQKEKKEEVENDEREVKDDPLREELFLKLKTLKEKVFRLESTKTVFEGLVEKKEKKNMELQEKVAEIETQLEEAEEKTRRTTSKIRKISKVHHKVGKTQEELKKWQAKLYKMAEEVHHDDLAGAMERDRHGTDGFVSEDGFAGSDGEGGDPRKVSSVRNLHINLNQLPGTYSPVADTRRRLEREREFAVSLDGKRNGEKGGREGGREGDMGRAGEEYQFDDVEMMLAGKEEMREEERGRGEGRTERAVEELGGRELQLKEKGEAKEAMAQAKVTLERQQATQGRNREDDLKGGKEGLESGKEPSSAADEGAALSSPEDSAFPKNALALASSKISFQLKGDKIGFKAIRPPIPAVLLGSDKEKADGNGPLFPESLRISTPLSDRHKGGTERTTSPSFLPLRTHHAPKGIEEEEVDVDSMDEGAGGLKSGAKNVADSPVDMDLQD